MVSTTFFVLATQLLVIFAELPPIQKCTLTDSSCIKTSAQAAVPIFTAGMPEIGAEPLDTMKIDNIKVNLAGLNLNVDDVTVKGLRKAVIDKIGVDMSKKQMLVSWESDIVFKGRYVASGRLLVLPISGDGDLTIKLKKLHIDLTLNFDMSQNENGQKIIDMKNYKYKFDVKESAHFALTNLFNGNKALSDAMLNFMNQNWKVLSNEFGNAMLEKPMKIVFESMKSYFKSQPLEDLTLNE